MRRWSHNLDTFFGWGLRHGTTVVANDAIADPLEPIAVADVTIISASQTERARRIAELVEREALVMAEHANHTKVEFLSQVSHELRTPLNSILGFAQILGLKNLDPNDHVAVTNNRRAGEHLLRLVQDLIDSSQVEFGNLAVTTRSVELARFVEQVQHLPQHDAEHAAVTLTSGIGIGIGVTVLADPTRLAQMLVSVVSNAIKYSPTGSGWKCWSTSTSTTTTTTTGSTSGWPGIPVDLQPRVFEPFDRLGAEQSHVAGTGIGLAVAQHLVCAMDGRLERTSSPPAGAVFTVTLPAA